ncbi:hypothetical protein BGZ63DRAFT_421400 [Mariannaea sp. PMI_226]|nr:hypothetical protein BGZ63DRAFT_421400 [Mariannaea sp. PMI_226]
MSYTPVCETAISCNPESPEPHHEQCEELAATGTWPGGPKSLKIHGFALFFTWVWNALLVMGPILFIILAVLGLHLDGQPISSYGQHVVQLTLLSPTIYPILFTAIAARFYRNFARWRLEKRQGIELGLLEQIFGSQSLAGALERLLFVRTQITAGLLILFTWSLSPLGGQSAARLIDKGYSTKVNNGTVYYHHPSFQFSSFLSGEESDNDKASINTLYTSSLLSSSDQKRSPRDLWNLPRIPRFPTDAPDEEERDVDLSSFSEKDSIYTSLLGLGIQGLDFQESGASQYNFTVESSYFDFDCDRIATRIPFNQSNKYFPEASLNLTKALPAFSRRYEPFHLGYDESYNTFAASIAVPITLDTNKSISLNKVPPGYMLFVTIDWVLGETFNNLALFNCSMERIILHSDIQCGPSPSSTTCKATRQKRINNRYSTRNFPLNLFEFDTLKFNLLDRWRNADRNSDMHKMSPTGNYLAGSEFPFNGQVEQNWSAVNVTMFSRRLTTAFNTYYQASLAPANHTTNSFTKSPSEDEISSIYSPLNLTLGTASTKREVYRTKGVWVTLLLITTFILEILALLGILLQSLIRGPDVLGFASTMTRDNPYCATAPPGGTFLDGPDRARQLRQMRVQLADILPGDEKGYIAFRDVPLEHQIQSQDQQYEGISAKPSSSSQKGYIDIAGPEAKVRNHWGSID